MSLSFDKITLFHCNVYITVVIKMFFKNSTIVEIGINLRINLYRFT